MQKVPRLTIAAPNKAARRVIAPYVKLIRKRAKAPVAPESNVFKKHLEKQPSVLRDLTTFLSDNVDLPSLLHEASEVLKTTTQAHGVSLYLVESASGEIYQSQKYFDIPEPRVRWKVEQGTIVAAYVASTKELVMIDDILQDERFPLGIGQKELTKAILCAPVVTADGDCHAVIELFKATSQGPFTEGDRKITTLILGWIGAAIHQNLQRVIVNKKYELNEFLLGLTKVYLEESVPMEDMLIEMVKLVKLTLVAERSAFYLLDKEAVGDELVADVYTKGINDTEDVQINYNVKLIGRDKTLIVNVARDGIPVNVKDLFNDPNLTEIVDEKTGSIVRSALCIAVKGYNGILGVVEVVNKKKGCFLQSDEILFDIFATYFSLVLESNEVYQNQKKVVKMNTMRVDLLKRQIGPCVHDINFVMNNLNIRLPNKFLQFKWTIHDRMVDEIPLICYAMFRELFDPAELDVPNLTCFILSLRKFEGDMPYHNFGRAFDFCHCLYIILKNNVELFSPLEVKALLIAALCHCVGREGCTTNEFLALSNSDIYQIYPQNSWQNYHCMIAIWLYEQFPIFKGLTNQEYNELLEKVKENIILTDLKNSFFVRSLSDVVQILNGDDIDYEDPGVLRHLKLVIIICCCFSNFSKDYAVTKKNLVKFRTQMCQEGSKIEKLMPDSIVTRYEESSVETSAEFQLVLLEEFILKVAKMLKEFLPNTDEFYNNIIVIKSAWLDTIELRGRKVWKHEDSYWKKEILFT